MAYAPLSTQERVLLARLAIFRGGCTLEAAEDICDASVGVLDSLVARRVVRHSEGRYWLGENARRHASDLLQAEDESGLLRSRHAEYFLAESELAARQRHGRPPELVGRLAVEQGNLQAALEWLHATGDTQNAMLLAAAQSRIATTPDELENARTWLETTLAEDVGATEARAWALAAASELALGRRDVAAGRAQAEEALAIHRYLDDLRGAAHSTFILGRLGVEAGEFETAQLLFVESLGMLDDHALDCLANVAFLHAHSGRAELATSLLSSSLALQEKTDLDLPTDRLQLNTTTLARIREQLDDIAFTKAWERGRGMSLDEAIALAIDATGS